MRVARCIEAAALLITVASATNHNFFPHVGSRHIERDMDRAVRFALEGDLGRREPQTTTETTLPSNPSDDQNSTIARACLSTLDRITSVTNDADISACYNILSMTDGGKTFIADLRLYVAGAPRGQFVDIQPDNLMIGVRYPSSTVFSTANAKRSVELRKRQDAAPDKFEIQQYTLMGTIEESIDISKLNQTQIMSLMIPQITINAVLSDTRTPVQTNLTTTDTAYFVTGEFQGGFSVQAADPVFAQAAITNSAIFVLPGTTLGIFPVGMIVTMVWLMFFVLAYGLGTAGRISSRNLYRQRKTMVGGRVGAKI